MLCGRTVKELFRCTARRSGRWNILRDMGNGTAALRLERLGAVIRSCGNYPGLDDAWYRPAVRTTKASGAYERASYSPASFDMA